MTSDIPVSVCLTAYKRAKTIGKSIENLLAQDFADFELVISDDASPDETGEVCLKYARLDSRIRYFRNERNLGMPGNLNAGLKRTRAALVANLHDGDFFRSDLLRRWKAAMDRHEDAAFAFCQTDVLDGQGQLLWRRAPDLPEWIDVGDLVRFMTSSQWCYNSPVWGTVMGRRKAYESVGWFESRYSFVSDVAMWMKLNQRYPVAYVREPLIQLTPHEADRPYADVNWALERAIATMYEEAIDELYQYDPVATARERRRIRRLRDWRWAKEVGACLRRGKLDKMETGLAVCRAEDSLALKAVGCLGVPLLLARRRIPGVGKVVDLVDRVVRGRG